MFIEKMENFTIKQEGEHLVFTGTLITPSGGWESDPPRKDFELRIKIETLRGLSYTSITALTSAIQTANYEPPVHGRW
jgi:hypothetical protein